MSRSPIWIGELPARGAKFRRLLAPMVLARMLQAVTVVPSDRALDVAGGSGYGAAILAAMGAKVVLLESDAGAAEAAKSELHNRVNVTVVVGPLDSGAAALGPFDLIVVEGAFGVFPDSLIALIADPGRLVGIDASSEPSQAVVYEKNGGAISRRALFETKAEILDGFKPGRELRLLSHWTLFREGPSAAPSVSSLRRSVEKWAPFRRAGAARVARWGFLRL